MNAGCLTGGDEGGDNALELNTTYSSGRYMYSGNVDRVLISQALESYRRYKSDKEELIRRVRDNELFYRDSYRLSVSGLDSQMHCDTPFIFSAIENARAEAIDSYPQANILERSPEGTKVAELLSRIVPAQLEISEFRRAYKENMRSKLKYGTAVYGVFYNDETGGIDIKNIDILDVYVDMHISDIQDSKFLFISAAVENSLLREKYPQFASMFTGDASVDSLTGNYSLSDRSKILDCYYRKTDGSVHMMKICNDTVIAATEDMYGYENGLYSHGLYPVVFDVLYPVEHCPFGFGMIDIGKATQIEINKLDAAITENIMCGAKPRYLTKRSGGIDEEEFRDISKNIVHYEGDADSLKAIDTASLNESYLTHREKKKEELKEILANRDFQQGETSGGVTAASAIETLQQAGEKRARAMINDTYDSYRRIIYMMLELMRQFFSKRRIYRITDEMGQKRFAGFSNGLMYSAEQNNGITEWHKMIFDIDVVPQRENPYSRETSNNTLLTFWQSGLFEPQNCDTAVIALKNMNFDGKEKLIADLQNYSKKYAQSNTERSGYNDR